MLLVTMNSLRNNICRICSVALHDYRHNTCGMTGTPIACLLIYSKILATLKSYNMENAFHFMESRRGMKF